MAIRAARKHLIPFTEHTFPQYLTGAFHREVADQLERVERGEIDRLMILAPPRHGKSELTSRRLPAWFLGRNPHKHIISASAAETLAVDFGRDVRDIVRSNEFREVFPKVALSEDNRAAGRWKTAQGGSYFAVGVGTQIMGRGGHLNIIDDPFATWDDGQSEVSQSKAWRWYQGSLYNRQEPGGAIILINHRMHEGDLSGRVIERMTQDGADQWVIVECKAITDDEPLCPERYDLKALLRIKANTDPRMWSSLYQQNPQPDDGTFFRREWFEKRYETLPKVNIFGASDFAVTEEDGDYTEHGVFGVGPDSTIYAIDWWSGRTDANEWIERWLDLVKKHKPLTWFGEAGPIRRAIEGSLKRRMDERKAWCNVEWVPSVHRKEIRAMGFQALASQGKVSFPQSPWADEVLEQLIRFPGKFDDKVDVCGLIGTAVYETWPSIVAPIEPQTRPNDRYSRNRGAGSDSYKTA